MGRVLDRSRIRRGRTPRYVTWDELRQRFGCPVEALAPGVVVVAREPHGGIWSASSAAPLSPVLSGRLATLLGYVEQLGGRLRAEPWWAAISLDDAWLPAGGDGSGRPVLAFGRRVGDASTALLPDPHYVYSLGYLKTRVLLGVEDRAWSRKAPSAIYCGGRHGHELLRERLARLAPQMSAPVEVHLGGRVSRAQQLRHQMVVDVDGFARTWDAWAWKTRSRSAVLSQESVWESFFSVRFEPWQHFVPLANDLLDTEDKVLWCLANDSELHRIAERASAQARQVYHWADVMRRTREVLEQVVFTDT